MTKCSYGVILRSKGHICGNDSNRLQLHPRRN